MPQNTGEAVHRRGPMREILVRRGSANVMTCRLDGLSCARMNAGGRKTALQSSYASGLPADVNCPWDV